MQHIMGMVAFNYRICMPVAIAMLKLSYRLCLFYQSERAITQKKNNIVQLKELVQDFLTVGTSHKPSI